MHFYYLKKSLKWPKPELLLFFNLGIGYDNELCYFSVIFIISSNVNYRPNPKYTQTSITNTSLNSYYKDGLAGSGFIVLM